MVVIQLGAYHYNLEEHLLYDANHLPRKVRQQSLSVLHELALQANQVVSKQTLFTKVWPDIYVTDDSLTQCIADLRRILNDSQHEIIKTIARRGYSLIATEIHSCASVFNQFGEDLLPFVGRQRALQELEQRLADPACRLLNLLGFGGAGKSRLAKMLAKRLNSQFAAGIIWVELAPVHETALIPLAIANAANISLQGHQPALTQVQYAWGKQHILLVLDNIEHLLPEQGICQQLLEANPQLKILVTSRLPLNSKGEWLYPVNGLNHNAEDAAAGMELFVQTARRLVPNFAPDLAEQQAIHAICNLVEGLPLGIEIAASWVRCLSCVELLQELRKYLETIGDLTTVDTISAPALERVLSQSWQQLSAREQHVLQALSLFRGRFKRETAASLASVGLNELRHLIDQSIIGRHADGQFSLHEVMRQYARAQAIRTHVYPYHAQQFINYHLELANSVDTNILGQQQLSAIAQLEAEHDNFRECLLICSQEQSKPSFAKLGLELSAALGMFWFLANHWQEGFRWSEQFLNSPHAATTQLEQAKVLLVAGGLAALQDQHAEAERYLTQGIRDVTKLGEPVHLARGLVAIAVFRRLQGRYQESLAHGRQSLNLFSDLGDQGGYQISLVNMGHSLIGLQVYDQAIEVLEESIQLNQQLGTTLSLPYALVSLGRVHWQQQQLQPARIYLQEALAVTEKLGILLYRAQANCLLAGIAIKDQQAGLALSHFKQSLEDYLRLGDQAGQVEVLKGAAAAKVALGNLHEAWHCIVLAEHLIEVLKVPLIAGQQVLSETKKRVQEGLSARDLAVQHQLALAKGMEGLCNLSSWANA